MKVQVSQPFQGHPLVWGKVGKEESVMGLLRQEAQRGEEEQEGE